MLNSIDSWLSASKDLCYRHCYQINSGWKTDRSKVAPHSLLRHARDKLLARDLSVAFG
jgi:hypothetical protein